MCSAFVLLSELLTRLLRSAFEGYDLENMITAFLLARQGALEGPCVFPSYSDWFKVSYHFSTQVIKPCRTTMANNENPSIQKSTGS